MNRKKWYLWKEFVISNLGTHSKKTPTSVSVLRAFEIILAYLAQVIVLGLMPNGLGICGALIVMASVIGIAVEEKVSTAS